MNTYRGLGLDRRTLLNQIVECVANFSEGRRADVIDKIVSAIDDVYGISIFGWESDIDHNRSVVTFVGTPTAVESGAFAGVRAAAELIDMDRHQGQHPRIGATDVIPFIPLRNATMAECVNMAHSLGARVGEELNLPVFLYDHAALQEKNKKLADIRRGGYERLKTTIKTGEAPQPDFGPQKMERAGGCVIGARNLLIAFNVYLTTGDVKIGKSIARTIRESSGGLPHIRALGLHVKGKAQVSMNLTKYRVTSMQDVVDAIRLQAERYAVAIESSEIIGLIPRDALSDAQARQLQIANYGPERILDMYLAKIS